MKRMCFFIAAVMLLCLSAYAMKTSFFRSLEHMASCENLLIVQVPMSYRASPPPYTTHGPTTLDYNVEVVRDLRGERPVGSKVNVSVLRKLSPGSRYLLAGKPAARDGKPWLLFHGGLHVVEIPSTFKLATLEGKNTETQISIVLSARRVELKEQLQELRQEKGFIDRLIPEEASSKPDTGDGLHPRRLRFKTQ